MLRRMPRREDSADLNLTSMMDLFTIILTFLLMSLSTTDVNVAPSRELVLPMSSATVVPEVAVSVVVTRDAILVDGQQVVALSRVPDPDSPGQTLLTVPPELVVGGAIAPLQDVLLERARTAKALGEASGRSEHAFKGRVLLQCDRGLPYSLVRDVMVTAGQADFSEFKFVVYKQE